MFLRLLIFLIVIPATELYILLTIKEWFGWGWAILLVISTGFLGAALLRGQGLSSLLRIQEQMAKGGDPSILLSSALMSLVGGILLLTPGLLTDLLGLSLLLPWTQGLWRNWALNRWEKAVRSGQIHVSAMNFSTSPSWPPTRPRPQSQGDTLEAEVIEIERH